MQDSNRRSFFKYMALLGMVTFSATPLLAKSPKKQFLYQDHPKDGKECSECLQFFPKTNECRIVEGSISPHGWCVAFSKKP
ncbi:iron oxidase oxidoreductase [Sulfurimonas sp. HSL-1716]|uniref:iron oxidase oxidoreductase n=1 Tax=Hydrocurvibacter sulfurireducens TaxID=3131937 RepID=UPI0031FA0A55